MGELEVLLLEDVEDALLQELQPPLLVLLWLVSFEWLWPFELETARFFLAASEAARPPFLVPFLVLGEVSFFSFVGVDVGAFTVEFFLAFCCPSL